jgi:serine/threonine protein kinase
MTGKSVYTCPFCGREHSRILDLCPESKKRVPEVYRFEGLVIDDKYKLDRRIAEGGMGVVYAGTHLSIGRKIAVKFLHSEIATSEELITRFKNEARLAASIGHRNIVDIIDMGMLRKRVHYIVMEFLDGRDLDATLSVETRFSPEESTDLAIQILGGLKAAHRKGIVHRDLKPENIFLVMHPDGERYVKILDFGISKLLDETKVKDVKLTHTGMVFGTPRYMSPEQARGRCEVDHRADLYAVGAIYYEMLCGVPLFVADNYNELIVDVLTNEPVHLLERNPELPPDLAALVMKAVAKEAGDRFQTATDFIEAIAPFSSSPVFTRSSSGEIYFSDGRMTFTTGQVLDRQDRTPSEGRGRYGPSPIPTAPKQAPENLKAEIEAFSRLPTIQPDALSDTGDDMVLLPEESDTNLLAGSGSWSLRPSFPPQTVENSQVHIRPPRRSRAATFIAAVVAAVVAVAALWAGAGFYSKIRSEAPPPGTDKVVVASAAAVKAGPELVEIAIDGLPDDARVYVDDVLHAERPVRTGKSDQPRRIKVLQAGETLLDEKVVIMEGMALTVTEPNAAAGEDDGNESGKSDKKKKKKKSKKSTESPGGKKKRSIDMVYPL